jgi:type II secretory pathway pseudopilin PulG
MDEQRLLRPESGRPAPAMPCGHLPQVGLRGISLVEVLASVAIVAVLAALSLSAFSGARRRAKATHDTGHLRQIGMAHALYQTTSDSDGWFSIPPLVESGHLPQEIAGSPLDSRPQGLANLVRTERYPHKDNPPSDYKESYLAYDMTRWRSEGNRQRYTGYFAEAKGTGWLIAFDHPDNYQTFRFWDEPGRYQRLLMDGAVVWREVRLAWIGWGDRRNRGLKGCQLFTDDAAACERGGL